MNYNNIEFERSFGTAEQLPHSDKPEICFSGRSNVGKSSLINKLFNRKNLARVSTKPGKTITINFFDSKELKFVDLPGYGYAKVSKSEQMRWSELMEYYFGSERNIKMVFQLVDMRHTPSELDFDMLEFLSDSGYPFAVVATKSDKLNKTEYKNRLEELKKELDFLHKDIKIIPFSAVKGEGTEEIKEVIEKITEEL